LALDPSSLSSSLLALYTSPPKTVIEAAQRWAAAYSEYAADAQSCQGVVPLPAAVTASQGLLAQALVGAFTSIDPVFTAATMASAFTVFWLVPPVAFPGGTPGFVTAVAGTAFLEAALLTNWFEDVVDEISADMAAKQIAGLLDTFTRTVVVVHPLPAACAGPLY
jgi:hypothetical protein